MKTRQPAKTRQTALAGFSASAVNDLTPNPPTCHENQQASVSGALSPKVAHLLQLYEDDIHVRYGERTVAQYQMHIAAFMAWLAERTIALPEVASRDLVAYQTALYAYRRPNGRPYSAAYQANRFAALKNLFRFLTRRGYLLHDPAAEIELPRLDKRLPRIILTQQEARRLVCAPDVATPQGLRDRAILETLYATGIRVSELTNLTPYDVDTEERILRVLLGKGRKDRHVPLTRVAAEAIEEYLAAGRPALAGARKVRVLFLQDRGGKMNRATVGRIVQRWATKARIKKHVTCHTFRHTVATHLLKGRADIRHIQALLGHASLGTTQRYTRVEVSDLKRVLERAHPRGR
jgi:integrase/recombinase XerD